MAYGTRVGILAKNSDDFVGLLLGCGKLGAVAVGLNWRLAAAELRYIINDSDSRLLVVAPEFIPVLAGIRGEIKAVTKVVVLGPTHGDWPGLQDWLAQATDHAPPAAVAAEDAVLQLYTSGTTGNPKGVVLPQRAFFDPWVYQAQASMQWNEWQHDDVSLLAMPLFHVGGVGLLFMALRAGATTVIVPEYAPDHVMRLIAAYRVTRTFLVPAAIRALLLLPGAHTADWSSLRYMLYGAAPMPEALLVEAMALMQCEFVQQYGMTEVCGTVVYLPPADHVVGSPRLRAAGLPTPTTELRIIDRQGKSVKPGEVGEITLRSPANMLAYWRLPEATAKTLVDGYIHSGDAGYQDEDGYLYVVDRIKDMIISGGENIYPIEVENVLYQHPAITDAAVIGLPDEKWGEAVTAVVVLGEGKSVSATELIDYCRQQIASYKCPKQVIFIEELPRNASGKILKKDLRKTFGDHQDL